MFFSSRVGLAPVRWSTNVYTANRKAAGLAFLIVMALLSGLAALGVFDS